MPNTICECLHGTAEHANGSGACSHCKWCEGFTVEPPRRKRRFNVTERGPILERMRRLIRVSETGCWEWIGSTVKGGYGRVRYLGQLKLAHCVAWTVMRGQIPAGLKVCHQCDNPCCCNPDHLFLGTQKENMRDCIAKGRFSAGRYPRATPRKDQAFALGFQSASALRYHLRKGDSALLSADRWSSGRSKSRCGKCGQQNHNRRSCKAA